MHHTHSVRKALVLFAAILAIGVGLTACESLGPMLGSYKNQLESIVGVTVAGTYTIQVTKDGKTLVTETWTCTTDGTKLTGCHKINSQTTTPAVAAPVP